MRPEAEDPKSSPWQSFTMQERDQIKAAAREKIQGTVATYGSEFCIIVVSCNGISIEHLFSSVAKTAGKGCFVCALVRHHEGKPRNWQCCECKKRGRALTPLGVSTIGGREGTVDMEYLMN